MERKESEGERVYEEMIDETTHDSFLEYCYNIANLEFEGDPAYYKAEHYRSLEARVIIAAAERFEEGLNDMIEDEDEWNQLFEERK